MSGRFYITTAIDYPNNPPHLGTAYEKVTADVIARWHRMAGRSVHFLMGNDEHSVKVAQRAAQEGLSPQAWCDRMEEAFRERWAALDVAFDDFIRTSEERHKKGVAALIEAVKKRNPDDIFEGDYEGWYCTGCEEFKPEKSLVDGLCPQHPNRKPEMLKEKNHFFRLSKYREALVKHIEAHPEFVQPESRRNELLNVLKEGLQDLSISRPAAKALGWGIPFPGDPEKVVYVWFDALSNYITGVGYGTDEARFAAWWPADVHIVGKDITRFHCIIWPAMLMAAGVELPKRVFGHGWVLTRGEKISKSLGNVVEPLELAKMLGPDALRLYLVREIAYGQDGDFTLDRFEERYNSDLANNYGNLVSRITSMAGSYRKDAGASGDGDVKRGAVADSASPPSRLREAAASAVERARHAMDELALQDAATAAFELVDETNKYIQDEAKPWELAKDPARGADLDRALYDALEATRIATILLHPVMPRKTKLALERLGDPETPSLARASWGAAGATRSTATGDALFPRIEDPAKSKPPKAPKKK